MKLIKNNIWIIIGIASAILAAGAIAIFGAVGFFMMLLILASLILAVAIFKNPFLGFLILLFFLPFERIPSYDLGPITFKINQLIALILIVAWALGVLFNHYKISKNPTLVFLIIFLFTCSFSFTQAFNLSRAISVFIFILFMAVIYFVTINLVDSEEKLKKSIIIIFITTLITCLFALYQFGADIIGMPETVTGLDPGFSRVVFGFPRPQSFSMEPLYLANFLLIPIGLGLAFVFAKNPPIKRSNLIILVILMIIVFILTVSRGAYLGFIALLLLLAILMPKQIINWRNILIGLLSVAIILIAVFWVLQKAEPEAYENFIGHITLEDYFVMGGESTYGRLITYQDAIAAWKESPLFGIGLGNYGPYVDNYPLNAPEDGWKVVNNEYLEILAETGLIGLVAFLLFIISIIIKSFICMFKTKNKFLKTALIGLFVAFIGILSQYNFFSTLYIMYIWVAMGILVATQNLIIGNKKN